MKRRFKVLIFSALFIGNMVSWVQAGELDLLVDKLVEKGYLTQVEAQIILEETRHQVREELATGSHEAVPTWVQNLKLKGDMRVRYQYEKTDSSLNSRSRGRNRFRLNLETKPNKQILVGAGLASGGTDPRSTNVTWDNTFERPDFRLDAAFVQYQPVSWAKMVGGKFYSKDYLWNTTDMLWDSDINPNGGSLHLENSLLSQEDLEGKWFVNAGGWVLDENGASKAADPNMEYLQGGIEGKVDKFGAKLAGTYYIFNGVKGYDLDNDLSINTKDGGVLRHDYDSGAASVELSASELFGGLPYGIDEKMKLFADYIYNPDPDEQNKGWAAGMQFGNSNTDALGKWNMKYQYVYLGKDAWLDTFPDSDRYGGRTDVKGHEVILTLGLLKNVSFSVDWYHTNRIKAASNAESIVQGDLNIKF